MKLVSSPAFTQIITVVSDAEWSAHNPVVVGRPGQRRPRQAVPGSRAARGPLNVGAVILGPLRFVHHALFNRLERCPFFRLAAQLTRGERPPSRARTYPRPFHRSSPACTRAVHRQGSGEARPLLFHQTRCKQEVRRS